MTAPIIIPCLNCGSTLQKITSTHTQHPKILYLIPRKTKDATPISIPYAIRDQKKYTNHIPLKKSTPATQIDIECLTCGHSQRIQIRPIKSKSHKTPENAEYPPLNSPKTPKTPPAPKSTPKSIKKDDEIIEITEKVKEATKPTPESSFEGFFD